MRLIKIITIIFSCFLIQSNTLKGQGMFPTGAVFDQEKIESVPLSSKLTTRSYGALPSSASLLEYCPSVKKQNYQDCTGWASAYYARTIIDAIDKNYGNITGEAFSPSFIYEQVKLESDCSEGAYLTDALEVLIDDGAAKYSDIDYTCGTNYNISNARQFKILDFQRISSINYSTEDKQYHQYEHNDTTMYKIQV